MMLSRLVGWAVAGNIVNVIAAMLAVSIVLVLPLMSGCAGPGDDGIGGTGISARDSEHAATDPDGIGGTGIVGEIAALGMADGATVTQLDVAGLTVQIDNDTTVQRAGQYLQSDAFARGQIVAVLAQHQGGRLIARDIRLVNALVGRVTRNDEGNFAVLGQQLAIDSDTTKFAPPFESRRSISVGDRVRVSGLWRRGGDLLVTRVAPATKHEPDSLFAPVSAVRGQRLLIGSLQINSRQRLDAQVGDYIEVSGSAADLVLQASSIRMAAASLFANRLTRVIVDGFATGAGQRIGAISTELPDSTRLRARIAGAAREGQRVIARLEIRSGAAQIRGLRPLAPRRALRDPLPIPRMMPKQPPSTDLPEPARKRAPAQSSVLPVDEAPAQNARPIERRSALTGGSIAPQPIPRVVPVVPFPRDLKRLSELQGPLESPQAGDVRPGDGLPRRATGLPQTRGVAQ